MNHRCLNAFVFEVGCDLFRAAFGPRKNQAPPRLVVQQPAQRLWLTFGGCLKGLQPHVLGWLQRGPERQAHGILRVVLHEPRGVAFHRC